MVLDYWKQEMAVTGDETESGRVSLTHIFNVMCTSLHLLFGEMHVLHVLSVRVEVFFFSIFNLSSCWNK